MDEEATERRLALFHGPERVLVGSVKDVEAALRTSRLRGSVEQIRVFDLITGSLVDLDLRDNGLVESAPEAPRRGRPRLGVVAREVTLLPRHWDWLSAQPGGASVTLRRLIDLARKAGAEEDHKRGRIEATYRFMVEMAGDLAGFEEASRALFGADTEKFGTLIKQWPQDIQDHLRAMMGVE